MTTMPIDNHPLTQKKLQFIVRVVNKLALKSINIIQLSNIYNIVSSFIGWNQNIVHMKILDTSFKMRKRIFRSRDKMMCFTRVKRRINNLKNIFHSFKASGSTFSS